MRIVKTQEKQILFLSLEDVINCGGTDVAQAADDLENGFRLLYSGKIIQPMKTTLRAKKDKHEHSIGLVNFLPAYISLGDEEVISCKALGAMPSNVERGFPRATGVITLFDSETKSPICIMDAQAISATRTGGVSLLAARKFASSDIEEIGLVGAGVNMRTQLLGLSLALKKLKKVRIFSRGNSKKLFAKEMGERTGLSITPVESAKEAVSNCRMYVTCLPNVNKPAVMNEYVIKQGVTIFNIGCYENEDTILARMDRVIADIWEQGKHRGVQSHAIAVAHGIIPEQKIEDLAPIIAGVKPGRISENENIFFCPTGLGFEDAIVAWRVYKNAVDKQIGTWLTLWKSHKWI